MLIMLKCRTFNYRLWWLTTIWKRIVCIKKLNIYKFKVAFKKFGKCSHCECHKFLLSLGTCSVWVFLSSASNDMFKWKIHPNLLSRESVNKFSCCCILSLTSIGTMLSSGWFNLSFQHILYDTLRLFHIIILQHKNFSIKMGGWRH